MEVKLVDPPVVEKLVQLTMTKDEARLLYDICVDFANDDLNSDLWILSSDICNLLDKECDI
jgi:Fe-S cluster assembly iron-binding protein IscA